MGQYGLRILPPPGYLTSFALIPAGRALEQMMAFPRKRLVKHCTMRFRGNAIDATAGAITIRADAPVGGMTVRLPASCGRPAGVLAASTVAASMAGTTGGRTDEFRCAEASNTARATPA